MAMGARMGWVHAWGVHAWGVHHGKCRGSLLPPCMHPNMPRPNEGRGCSITASRENEKIR